MVRTSSSPRNASGSKWIASRLEEQHERGADRKSVGGNAEAPSRNKDNTKIGSRREHSLGCCSSSPHSRLSFKMVKDSSFCE